MFCVDISNIATITVKGGDCCCIIHGISKPNTINLLGNSVLDDRGYINNLCKEVFIKNQVIVC